jgi:hypothetical protein
MPKRHIRYTSYNCQLCVEFFKRGQFMGRSYLVEADIKGEYIRLLKLRRFLSKINRELQ